MLSRWTVYVNVLRYLKDWRDRENFTLTSKTMRALLCLLDMKSVSALETETSSFSSLKRQSVRSVIINESAALTAREIVNGIKSLTRLEVLTIKADLNRRGVRTLVNLLTSLERPVQLLSMRFSLVCSRCQIVDQRTDRLTCICGPLTRMVACFYSLLVYFII